MKIEYLIIFQRDILYVESIIVFLWKCCWVWKMHLMSTTTRADCHRRTCSSFCLEQQKPTTWTQWSHISHDAPPLMVHFKQWLPFHKQSEVATTWLRQKRKKIDGHQSTASYSFKIWLLTIFKQTEKQLWIAYFCFLELILFFQWKPKCASLFPLLFTFQPVFSQPACRG